MKTLIIRVILTFIICYITVGFVTWNWTWVCEDSFGYILTRILTTIITLIVAFINAQYLNSNR